MGGGQQQARIAGVRVLVPCPAPLALHLLCRGALGALALPCASACGRTHALFSFPCFFLHILHQALPPACLPGDMTRATQRRRPASSRGLRWWTRYVAAALSLPHPMHVCFSIFRTSQARILVCAMACAGGPGAQPLPRWPPPPHTPPAAPHRIHPADAAGRPLLPPPLLFHRCSC